MSSYDTTINLVKDEIVGISKDSKKFYDYLDTLAKFPQYSFNNLMQIFRVNKDATMLNREEAWYELGRTVTKDQLEKGVALVVPGVSQDQNAPEFRRELFYDVSQTEGRHLVPKGLSRLTSTDFSEVFKKALFRLQPISTMPTNREDLALRNLVKAKYDKELDDACINSIVYTLCKMYDLNSMLTIEQNAISNQDPRDIKNILTTVRKGTILCNDLIQQEMKKICMERKIDLSNQKISVDSLAADIDQFFYNYNSHDYFEMYESRDVGFQDFLSKIKANPIKMRHVIYSLCSDVKLIPDSSDRDRLKGILEDLDDYKKDVDAEKELDFCLTDNAYAIYQLRDTPENRDIRFEPIEAIDATKIDKKNYELVYYGILDKPMTTNDKLDYLYQMFNCNHPDDFFGHSLSTGDIISLNENRQVSAHFCNRYGFTILPNFLAEGSKETPEKVVDGPQEKNAKKPSILGQIKNFISKGSADKVQGKINEVERTGR